VGIEDLAQFALLSKRQVLPFEVFKGLIALWYIYIHEITSGTICFLCLRKGFNFSGLNNPRPQSTFIVRSSPEEAMNIIREKTS
jgi:hypothetical protein